MLEKLRDFKGWSERTTAQLVLAFRGLAPPGPLFHFAGSSYHRGRQMSTRRIIFHLTGGAIDGRFRTGTAPPAAPPSPPFWGGAAGLHPACVARPPEGTGCAPCSRGPEGARLGGSTPTGRAYLPPELRAALGTVYAGFPFLGGGPRRRRGGGGRRPQPQAPGGAPCSRGQAAGMHDAPLLGGRTGEGGSRCGLSTAGIKKAIERTQPYRATPHRFCICGQLNQIYVL